MTNLPKRNPAEASEIYRQLIVRVKKSVKDKECVVFDPITGIQKCFLDGKLIWVKYIRNTGVRFDKSQE